MVGDLRLDDRGIDLAIALCIASAAMNRPLPADAACVGELSLTGELRPVAQMESRLKECARLGFKRIIVPKSTKVKSAPGMTLIPTGTVAEAIETIRYCSS